MPLPKRPFITSSLTSTLKSTIASQPLLSNLNEKISSQAASWTQKASPFFGSSQENNSTSPSTTATTTTTTSSQQQFHTNSNDPLSQQNKPFASASSSPIVGGTISTMQQRTVMNQDMLSSSSSSRSPAPPAVDMSHLTEEERIMIQSVMAKAEMAEMGLHTETPVSQPSSSGNVNSNQHQLQKRPQTQTQLQSNFQHQTLQEQYQTQQQSIQPQMQIQQQLQHSNQNQIALNQQAQASFMAPQQMHQPSDSMMSQLNNPQQQQIQQLQFPMQQQHMSQQQTSNVQMQNNQTQFTPNQSVLIQNQDLVLRDQQINKQIDNDRLLFQNNAQSGLASMCNQQQSAFESIEQQTGRLISQINSQFGLEQTGPSSNQLSFNNAPNMRNDLLTQEVTPPNHSLSNTNQFQTLQQTPGVQHNIQQDTFLSHIQQHGSGVRSGMNVVQQNSLAQQQRPDPIGCDGQPSNIITQQNQFAHSNKPTVSYNPQYPQEFNLTNTQQSSYNPNSNIFEENQFNLLKRQQQQQQQQQQKQQQQLQLNAMDLAGREMVSSGHAGILQRNLSLNHDVYMNEKQLSTTQNLPQYSNEDSNRFNQRISTNQFSNNYQTSNQQDYHDNFEPDNYSPQGNTHVDLNQSSQMKKVRQLPDPNCQSPNQSTPDVGSDGKNTYNKNKIRHQQSKQTQRVIRKAEHAIESPDMSPYQSPASEDMSESKKKQATDVEKKRVIVKEQLLANSNSPNSQDTKTDEALRLLGELKLTEQAAQVMEQQQMLIKQSQELIKLQLEQQVLSQELRKTFNAKSQESQETVLTGTEIKNPDEEQKQQQSVMDETKNDSKQVDEEKESNLEQDKKNKKEDSSMKKDVATLTKDQEIFKKPALKEDRATSSNCSRIDQNEESEYLSSDQDQKPFKCKNQPRHATKVYSASVRGTPVSTQTSRNSNTANSYTSRSRKEFYSHSPTDTTDSDFETLSATLDNKRNFARPQAQSSKRPPLRKREPTGLPPSPLPVQAAIQLHQLQLKANKDANYTNRPLFSRSRSVTCSPNHHRELGVTTNLDNQYSRCRSPDVMSDFGGIQRRRKRLPEPPTNAIPLTPSMVRKMIQIPKPQTANCKLMHSINIQSTNLTNTHSRGEFLPKHTTSSIPDDTIMSKNGNLKRNMGLNSSLTGLVESELGAVRTSSILKPSSQSILSTGRGDLRLHHNCSVTGKSIDPNSAQKTGLSDINKFLTSTYGKSILKNSPYASEVKETTELEKLISNWDEFYKMDSKRRPAYFNPEYKLSENLEFASNRKSKLPSYVSPLHIPSRRFVASQPVTTSYPGHQSALLRRSSEGENSLHNRYEYSGYTNSTSIRDDSHLPLRDSSAWRTNYNPSNPIQSRYDRYTSTAVFNSPTRNRTNLFAQSSLHRSNLGVELGHTARNLGMHTQSLAQNISEVDNSYPVAQYVQEYDHDKIRTAPIRSFQQYVPPGSTNVPLSAEYNHRPQISQFQYRSLDLDRPCVSSVHPQYHMANKQMYSPKTQKTANKSYGERTDYSASGLQPQQTINYFGSSFTKDDIPNYSTKFSPAGYRYQTENSNKYVTPTEVFHSVQTYPHPYKRLLLCKNPKDRLGNGIGVSIAGGISKPFGKNGLYDKFNRCIVTCAAFVTQVFRNAINYSENEINEGDQIVEWNGVKFCNKSNEEVQQLLFMMSSDDEVDIVFLRYADMKLVYEEINTNLSNSIRPVSLYSHEHGIEFDKDLVGSSSNEVVGGRVLSEFMDMKSPTKASHSTSRHSKKFYSGMEPTMSNLSRRFSLSSLANIWSR